jgi:predicted DNA-binding transcriptional regulator AlpA
MAACTRTRLLTSQQAADRLGISRNRLTALRRDPTGPEWGRFGGAVRYDIDELDAWARRQRNGSSTQDPPVK